MGTTDDSVKAMFVGSGSGAYYGMGVSHDTLGTPDHYGDILSRFNDWPRSTPEVVAELDRIEAEAGARLRARLEE